MKKLLRQNSHGIYCDIGDFYIDPWRPVDFAVITHAHSDHARRGSKYYLSTQESLPLLYLRLGEEAPIQTLAYGETISHNGVKISLHPAGHILGSAQVRVEHQGEVWVVSGDYKTESDLTCTPFEAVTCHTFITESTFGLPIYQWRPQAEVFEEINRWWRQNQEQGRTSVLYGYAVGKAQRLLRNVDPTIGPIAVHGAVDRFLPLYESKGIQLPKVQYADAIIAKKIKGKALVIAPPSANDPAWLKKFAPFSTAFASGWMQIRGTRRRRALDRGFVISDHVDWHGILNTIKATGASSIGITHGYTSVLQRYLQEQGYDAWTISTQYVGEVENEIEPEVTSAGS